MHRPLELLDSGHQPRHLRFRRLASLPRLRDLRRGVLQLLELSPESRSFRLRPHTRIPLLTVDVDQALATLAPRLDRASWKTHVYVFLVNP